MPCCIVNNSHNSQFIQLDTHLLVKAVVMLFFPQQAVVWGEDSKGLDAAVSLQGMLEDGSSSRESLRGVVLWSVLIVVMMNCGLKMKCFSMDIFMLSWR